MRPRLIAVAAFLLVALAGAAVALTLKSGRTPDQVARVIGPRTPIPAPAAPAPTAPAETTGSEPAAPPPTATTSADPAPDFEGITHWHKSAPLTLKALRGKVVLVDFWTYSCINCRRTFPLLRALHQRYAAAGLAVVGVHTPEFDFEKSHANVTRAVRELDITWPVAEDPQRTTWAAYGNEYWPTVYLVDRAGRLRSHHVGEGGAGIIEDGVRRLLAEGGTPGQPLAGVPTPSERPPAPDQRVTPELYLGSARGQGMVTDPGPVDTGQRVRRRDRPGKRNTVDLTGDFRGGDEWVEADPGSRIGVAFRGRDMYVTASAGPDAARGARLEVTLDGAPVPPARRGRDIIVLADGSTAVDVAGDDLHHLVTGPGVADGTLALTVRGTPVRLYTLTFGG